MSTYRFAVNVTPKPGILDPQGRAVEGSLDHLGISDVTGVRVGRRVELTVEAPTRAPPEPWSSAWPGNSWPTRSSRSTTSSRSRARRRRPASRPDRPARPRGRASHAAAHRGRRLPRLQLRSGHRARAGRCRRRAGRAVARTGLARWGGSGRPAGRVRLRRLPARRGHRPVQPGDAGRRLVRRGRWARARDLQRVPGARRGRSRAGRPAPQPVAAVRRAGRARSPPRTSTRPSPTPWRRAARCGCRSPTARAATTATTRRSTTSSATAASCSATWTRPGPWPRRTIATANPNGSLRAIAGVRNAAGNVAGLMPHPERAAEAILGSADGAGIVRSLVESAAKAAPASRSWRSADDRGRARGSNRSIGASA